MKNLLLPFILIASIFSIGASEIITKANDYAISKQAMQIERLGIVTNIDGIYVYILSVPNTDYERIGTVEKHFAMTGSNNEMITALVKKAKKEFSQCQAIIFTGYVFDKCEVIKFK